MDPPSGESLIFGAVSRCFSSFEVGFCWCFAVKNQNTPYFLLIVYVLNCPCVSRSCRFRRSARSVSGAQHWAQSQIDLSTDITEIDELKTMIADLKRDIASLEFTTLVEMKDSLASMEKDLAAKLQQGQGEDSKQYACTLHTSSTTHHMLCLSVPNDHITH